MQNHVALLFAVSSLVSRRLSLFCFQQATPTHDCEAAEGSREFFSFSDQVLLLTRSFFSTLILFCSHPSQLQRRKTLEAAFQQMATTGCAMAGRNRRNSGAYGPPTAANGTFHPADAHAKTGDSRVGSRFRKLAGSLKRKSASFFPPRHGSGQIFPTAMHEDEHVSSSAYKKGVYGKKGLVRGVHESVSLPHSVRFVRMLATAQFPLQTKPVGLCRSRGLFLHAKHTKKLVHVDQTEQNPALAQRPRGEWVPRLKTIFC